MLCAKQEESEENVSACVQSLTKNRVDLTERSKTCGRQIETIFQDDQTQTSARDWRYQLWRNKLLSEHWNTSSSYLSLTQNISFFEAGLLLPNLFHANCNGFLFVMWDVCCNFERVVSGEGISIISSAVAVCWKYHEWKNQDIDAAFLSEISVSLLLRLLLTKGKPDLAANPKSFIAVLPSGLAVIGTWCVCVCVEVFGAQEKRTIPQRHCSVFELKDPKKQGNRRTDLHRCHHFDCFHKMHFSFWSRLNCNL